MNILFNKSIIISKEWILTSGALLYFFSLNLSQTLIEMLLIFNAE